MQNAPQECLTTVRAAIRENPRSAVPEVPDRLAGGQQRRFDLDQMALHFRRRCRAAVFENHLALRKPLQGLAYHCARHLETCGESFVAQALAGLQAAPEYGSADRAMHAIGRSAHVVRAVRGDTFRMQNTAKRAARATARGAIHSHTFDRTRR
jgi:hypothetical protein